MAEKVLRLFAATCFPRTTADVSQRAVDFYADQRREALGSPWSLQKEVAKLRTFVNWLTARGLHHEPIQWPRIRAEQPEKRALSDHEIRRLIAACHTPAWRMRVLLSLCTGLRSSDVDALHASDIDWNAGAIATRSTKTRKRAPRRPLPDALMTHLREYVDTLRGDKLLPDRNVRYAWFAIRDRAGLPTTTRQDLRVTFSTHMQRVSGETATRLLEHCDPRVTQAWYTDHEVLDKLRVNMLPVDDWLRSASAE